MAELYDDNATTKVILRFVGWLLTWLGLQLLTGPLTIFPDIVPGVGPCIGDLMGAALCCVTLMISLAASLFVGAVAWIFVRPLLSLALLFFCGALAGGTWYVRQNKGALTGEKAAASKDLPIAQAVAVACQPGMEVQVQVPAGMVSGQMLTIDPDGPQGALQPVQVRIPDGVSGGQMFAVMIPPQQPLAVAVATAVNPVATEE